jgi:hypothetical protein
MKLNCLAAAAALGLAAAGAGAATIDFNELASPGTTMVDPLTSGGYLFTNNCGSTGSCLGVWGTSESAQADPGHAAVFVNHGGTHTTMAQVGGGNFDFYSIDLADVYDTGVSSTMNFSFNFAAGGSISHAVTLDNLKGLQTFVFDQHGLSSVSWVTTAGDSGWGQFDNINTAAVPEPESYALMLAGLLAIGTLVRRRQA